MSAAVWMLYVPHYTVLRLLGPRFGMAWVRFAARFHWLLTFVGARWATRRMLQRMAPQFTCSESVSEILFKHLQMKHECFARVRVYNLQGTTADRNDLRWEVSPACRAAIPEMNGRERGLLLVGFHFGFFQMSAKGLSQALPGCNPVQLRYRDAQCAEHAASPIVRLAIRKALEADRRSGAQFLYVDDSTNLMPVIRMLRDGACVAVAADGMLADEFVEVPFLDGTLRVPSGWARLAAITRSDIAILVDRGIDRRRREGLFYNHVRCAGTSTEAIHSAIAETIHVLERMIREEPWGWHPWQRLGYVHDADGSPRYSLRQYRSQSAPGASMTPASFAPDTPAEVRRLSGPETALQRPRVAVVCNSFTPYRIHMHERLVAEIPDIELWSLATHGNAYSRWTGVKAPASIRPLEFGHGEPTNEQTMWRFSVREWLKAGRMIRWLQERDVAAVFCQGCGDVGRLRLIRWCHRRQIPCFLTGDFNVRGDAMTGIKRLLKRAVYTRAVRWSSGLMPCGAYGHALFDRYGGAMKPQFLFPFVPDVKLFERVPDQALERVRQRFQLDAHRRRIVFSARMMPAKRPDLAVRGFAAIADERPDWDLIMLGDGALRSTLESSVPAGLKNRIRWTGFLNDPVEVAAIYAQSDVLLLPSDHEPWGVVIVEAAAAGLAIVASDVVGAAPELVHDLRNGSVFAAGNLASLADALRSVTASDRIDTCKHASREVVSEWLATADPVAGFRAALSACRLLNDQRGVRGGPAVDDRKAGKSVRHARRQELSVRACDLSAADQ